MTDSWQRLRRFTPARIGLGRAGAGILTAETLRFKLAHAQARDAVRAGLALGSFLPSLSPLAGKPILLHSAARNRSEYLRRPDLGRCLDAISRERLQLLESPVVDVALVIVDGLSALAIEKNAAPFLEYFLGLAGTWQLAPICVVQAGRVAVGDEIGQLLQARCVVVLVGERPGLSSPDSMGIYLTFAPQPGLTDEKRNCISNVHAAGLSHPAAARKLAYLIGESLRRKISGVDLKDDLPLESMAASVQGLIPNKG
ncbi:MAG TPA: ethanolamine ammonia-lyase subunit EutC [Verrucomicrobiae bacterium]|jgi:ethanolamine ammonia-lyase small subunit